MEEGDEGEGVVDGVGGIKEEDCDGSIVRGLGVMVDGILEVVIREVVVLPPTLPRLSGDVQSSDVNTRVYVMTVTGEDTETGGGGAVVVGGPPKGDIGC